MDPRKDCGGYSLALTESRVVGIERSSVESSIALRSLGDRGYFVFRGCCLGIFEQPVATNRDAQASGSISKLRRHADGWSGSCTQRSAGLLEPQ
jgi:hypothetical protein